MSFDDLFNIELDVDRSNSNEKKRDYLELDEFAMLVTLVNIMLDFKLISPCQRRRKEDELRSMMLRIVNTQEWKDYTVERIIFGGHDYEK